MARADRPGITATANVHLWGKLVGRVTEFTNGRIGFAYDKDYVAAGRALSPRHLPLGSGMFEFPELHRTESFHGLPGVLADSLPDGFGNKILRKHFEARGEQGKMLSPVQRLLYVGKHAMGALEFTPVQRGKTKEKEQALEVRALVEASRGLIDGSPAEAVQSIMGIGGYAGGARAKALVLWDQELNQVRSGFATPKGREVPWLIKLDGIGVSELDPRGKLHNRIEYTYALLAKQVGIDMAEVSFLEDGGLFHLMSKRFDRAGAEKLPMHSLGGLAHVDFTKPQAFSYEAWFRLMLELKLGHRAMEQGFKRMVFNIVGRNQNDHVKNISFLLDGMTGQWRLAPAYGLTFEVGAGNTARHQMTLGGKTDNFTRELLVETGKKFDIRHPGAVVDQVIDAFAGWSALAGQYGVPTEQVAGIERRLRVEY